jgi:hypothetical protein
MLGKPEDVAADTAVHRVGGGDVANLRLSLLDQQEVPPGISVLLGGTPQEAAEQMRRAFPKSRKWRDGARIVATATASAIRVAGFDVLPDPTAKFPNHARLTHPDDSMGFTDERLEPLSRAFSNTPGC